MISIGSLEKSVEVFAKKLEKKGHKVSTRTHRSGAMTGCDTQRISKVELQVDSRRVQFLANGYGAIYGGDIGDTFMTWTEMKAEAVKLLNLEPL